jgi:hypothetical protein
MDPQDRDALRFNAESDRDPSLKSDDAQARPYVVTGRSALGGDVEAIQIGLDPLQIG